MIYFVSFFCFGACLLSGYVGGYCLDKQMKATGIPFRRVTIPNKIEILFHFYRLYSNNVLLIGLIPQISALLFSAIIVITFYTKHIQFPLMCLTIHCLILLIISGISYFKYAYHQQNMSKHFGRVWKFELAKHFSQKPIICTVKVLQTPMERLDGLYQIQYGSLHHRSFLASCAADFTPSVGTICYALYRRKPPYFQLLSDQPKK